MTKMIPCKNPKLCKVESHHPGTQALCSNEKKGTSNFKAKASIAATPSLATSGSQYTPAKIERDTENLEKWASNRSTRTQADLDRDSMIASQHEQVLKLTKEPNIIKFAKSPDGDQQYLADLYQPLRDLGYTDIRSNSGRTEYAAALAVRIIQEPGTPEEAISKRVAYLSQDPYAREYADSIRQARLDEDFVGLNIATEDMHERLAQIGVPKEDVDGLVVPVTQQVQDNWKQFVDEVKQIAPAGERPEWKPFKVSEALERSKR